MELLIVTVFKFMHSIVEDFIRGSTERYGNVGIEVTRCIVPHATATQAYKHRANTQRSNAVLLAHCAASIHQPRSSSHRLFTSTDPI